MIRFIALLMLAVSVLSAPAMARDYFSAVEDLPLMPGMEEQEDKTVVFDSPQGRIVEMTAITKSDAQQVLQFYSGTLEPLGWSMVGATGNVYSREREELTIVPALTPPGVDKEIVFRLRPAPETTEAE